MARTSVILAALGASLSLSVACAPALAQTMAITVAVNDFTPLAAAAREIERISGIPVNYEDVRCDFPADQKDITEGNVTPAQVRLNGPVKVIVPRGGPLSATIAVNASTALLQDADATASALNSIISAYNASGTLPGSFRLESANGEFFLEPVTMRDVSGNTVPVQAVLSTPITLPLQRRGAYETLDLILAAASKASGFKIDIGMVPTNGLAMSHPAIGADQEPASHVLARLMNSLLGYGPILPAASPAFSYRVLYDVQLKYYMFNMLEVGYLGVRYNTAPIAAPPSGSGRPGWNKKP